ncbi:hypothetical protein EYZ11_006437 [Aspergillus tanneri]|uniref:Uncharacterized protein n=1 Tax=Aspergillus tanneri TaxID=1220188 RepID=A0A4S3JHQ8_9EURO|nr:hypothetical protein EYZ11_006437 [Aspergillus tanneri]
MLGEVKVPVTSVQYKLNTRWAFELFRFLRLSRLDC